MSHYNRNAAKINLAFGQAALLGCDVGGTSVKLVRVRAGRIERSSEIPTRCDGPAAALISDIALAIRSLEPRDETAGGRARGVCVGVALPGFLDEARERVLRLSNVPALDGVPLRARLERRLGLPVTLDTDTNAGALAEALLGAGRGFERVLYLTLGTGLGVAFVVGWRPVRVSHHTVGQAAHVPLRPRGTRCRCGERGCAEAELSAGGILRRARARGLRGLASTHELWELAGRRGAGSALKAREVWRETGRLLGLLCVTLGAIVDPDAIVIGGGVAAAAEQLLPVLEREIRDHLTPRLGRPVALRPAALGHLAGAVGAALLGARPA